MPLVINGWTILYHRVFGDHYRELRDEARRLKKQLSEDEYVGHPTVKLAAAIHRLIHQIVPSNPDADEFRLGGELARFRRAKGHGLPPRFRLFWVFSTQARAIIFLYLNDTATLRKEGARTDPYTTFKRLVDSGAIGTDFESNRRAWDQTHEGAPWPDGPR